MRLLQELGMRALLNDLASFHHLSGFGVMTSASTQIQTENVCHLLQESSCLCFFRGVWEYRIGVPELGQLPCTDSEPY